MKFWTEVVNMFWFKEFCAFRESVDGDILDATKKDGMWRQGYNFVLYDIFKGENIVRLIKIARLKWIDYVKHINEQRTVKNLLWQKLRWLDNVEQGINTLQIRKWWDVAKSRSEWKKSLHKPKALSGPYRQL